MKLKQVFIRLFHVMGKYLWLYLTCIIFMSVSSTGASIAGSYLLKEIMDAATVRSTEGLWLQITVILTASIALMFLWRYSTIQYNVEAKRAVASLERQVFAKSMCLPMSYYEQNHSGDFMSKLIYDVNKSGDIFSSRFRRLVSPILSVIIMIIPMMLLCWQVTMGLLCVNALTLFINTLFVKPMKNLWKELSKDDYDMTEKLTNLLAGIDLTKIFSAGESLARQYKDTNTAYLNTEKKIIRLSASLESLSNGLNLVNALLFLAMGVYFVQHGITTIGSLAAIYTLYGRFAWEFLQIGRYMPEMTACLANTQRVFEFLDGEEEPEYYRYERKALGNITGKEDKTAIAAEHGNNYKTNLKDVISIETNRNDTAVEHDNSIQTDGNSMASQHVIIDGTDMSVKAETDNNPYNDHIRFEHIDFAYNEERSILTDFTMSVQRGSTVALVGESGKGKSTIAKLLLGFYPINAGRIMIGNQDFSTLTLKEIRRQIAYVPQEPYLFQVSIGENIRYGKPEATMEEIIEAAKAANAHSFIMQLEQGYETICGERGNRLSGGEKQRIAIARAILKNAPVLLLDEATSALDNESELLVSEAIDRMMQGRTTIMIAHRPSTIARADYVIDVG